MIYTIGHSNHHFERFVELLAQADVTAIADVRSTPYSRHAEQYNREHLRDRLNTLGMAYVFLGDELGARPKSPKMFREGVADWDAMASTSSFKEALDRLCIGAQRYRIALLCAEKEPLDCHRTLLVARQLILQRNQEIAHLRADGAVEPHDEAERRLLAMTGLSQLDLFSPVDPQALLSQAYERRRLEVGWRLVEGNEDHDEE